MGFTDEDSFEMCGDQAAKKSSLVDLVAVPWGICNLGFKNITL